MIMHVCSLIAFCAYKRMIASKFRQLKIKYKQSHKHKGQIHILLSFPW